MFVKGGRVTWSRPEVTTFDIGLFPIGIPAGVVNDDPSTGNCEAPVVISLWDEAGTTVVSDKIDWWKGARLCLSGEVAEEASEELGFGTLVEMVDMAMSRPRHERPRLSIRVELSGAEVSWADIAQLARHPDKPTMI